MQDYLEKSGQYLKVNKYPRTREMFPGTKEMPQFVDDAIFLGMINHPYKKSATNGVYKLVVTNICVACLRISFLMKA